MTFVLIYGLIAIAIASAAAYSFVVFSSAERTINMQQENQVRMGTAAVAVRSSLLALNGDGVMFAPQGTTGGAYMQMPPLGIVSATPWGQPYLYCPVSPTGGFNNLPGTAATVAQPSGGNYAISTYPALANQNIPYVITSPTSLVNNSGGYVAFIVSSLPGSSTVPDCTQIVINAGGLSVPNGSVRGVSAGYSYSQRINASRDRMELYAGTASGDGSGRDVNNLMTLDNALALWQSMQPRLTTIYLAAGGPYATANDMNGEDERSTAQGENSSLVISPLLNAAGNIAVQFTGQLKLTANTTFQHLTITDSSTASPAIIAYKPLTLRNTTLSFTGTAAGIAAYNSSLTSTDSVITSTRGAGTTIGGANSSLNFFNLTAGTYNYNNMIVTGNLMSVNIDSAVAATTFDFGGTGLATGAINVAASKVNIGPNITLGINNTAPPSITLNASRMTLNGTYTHANGQPDDVQVLDGSSFRVAGGGANIGGVQVRGSKLAVDSTLISLNGIDGKEATVTGVASIKLGSLLTHTCAQFYGNFNATPGDSVISVDGYVNGVLPSATMAHFTNAKFGVPPLFTYNYGLPTSAFDLATGTALGPNNFLPYITYALPNSTYPLDPTTFASGVHYIADQDFINGGLHMNLSNASLCTP